MNCADWKSFLQDYVGGTLSETARAAVERHVADCPECLAEVRAHKMVDDRLRAQPVLEAPPGIVDRIMDRVFSGRSVSFRRELLRVAAVFIAAAGLGAGFLLTGLADRLPTEAARQALETSIRGAAGAADLFRR